MSAHEQAIVDAFNDRAQCFFCGTESSPSRRAHPALTPHEVQDTRLRMARAQQVRPVTITLNNRNDTITASAIRDTYQVYLTCMANVKGKNDGFSLVFMCIDVYIYAVVAVREQDDCKCQGVLPLNKMSLSFVDTVRCQLASCCQLPQLPAARLTTLQYKVGPEHIHALQGNTVPDHTLHRTQQHRE